MSETLQQLLHQGLDGEVPARRRHRQLVVRRDQVARDLGRLAHVAVVATITLVCVLTVSASLVLIRVAIGDLKQEVHFLLMTYSLITGPVVFVGFLARRVRVRRRARRSGPGAHGRHR